MTGLRMHSGPKSKPIIEEKSPVPAKPRIFLSTMSDITKEEHKVLVNSSNTDLDLSQGQVSNALIMKGGPSIQKECKEKYPNGIKIGDVAVTNGGNLMCKKLFHCCLPEETDEEAIQTAVKQAVRKCLSKANHLKQRSIGFPALGTGVLKYSPKVVAEAMYQATIQFGLKHPDCYINDVFFILHQKDTEVTKAFEAEDKKHQERIRLQNTANDGIDGSEFSSDDNQVLEYFYFRNNIENVTLVFVANSRETAEAALEELLKCYQSEVTTRTVDVPNLHLWSQHHIDLLIGPSFASNLDISVYKLLGRLELRGLKESIRQFNVDKNIKEATEDVHKRENAGLIAQQVQWNTIVVELKGHKFIPYDEINNFEIETAYQKGKACICITYPGSNVGYNINFTTMQECLENQVGVKDCERIQVIRRDVLQELTMNIPHPQHWAKMAPNDLTDRVKLKNDGEEYVKIANTFKESCKPANVCISRIERIQNITLYNQYCALKCRVQSQMPNHCCERKNLWHGTNEYAIESIIHNGFNRSFSDLKKNAYGDGVYFATEAYYSIRDEYAKTSTDGTRNVFLCSAVVGEYIKGEQNMRTLPNIPTCSDRVYNSAVDDVENPKIFVVFNDVQAYPEYLINFT